jgi:hypothetical protein
VGVDEPGEVVEGVLVGLRGLEPRVSAVDPRAAMRHPTVEHIGHPT